MGSPLTQKVTSAIRSLVNARGLQLECVGLCESLLVPVLTLGSEENERSRIRAAQMDNLSSSSSLLDEVPNAWIRESCNDERIDGGDRIAVCVCWVGRGRGLIP